jgi:hypothetical protein
MAEGKKSTAKKALTNASTGPSKTKAPVKPKPKPTRPPSKRRKRGDRSSSDHELAESESDEDPPPKPKRKRSRKAAVVEDDGPEVIEDDEPEKFGLEEVDLSREDVTEHEYDENEEVSVIYSLFIHL